MPMPETLCELPDRSLRRALKWIARQYQSSSHSLITRRRHPTIAPGRHAEVWYSFPTRKLSDVILFPPSQQRPARPFQLRNVIPPRLVDPCAQRRQKITDSSRSPAKACGFRRSRPLIPISFRPRFRLKPVTSRLNRLLRTACADLIMAWLRQSAPWIDLFAIAS